MPYPFYTGDPQLRDPQKLTELPSLKRDKNKDAAKYRPDPGLVDAVNVSLLLNKPLLVTGEPGTGKTQLAYSVAWELGFQDDPLVYETKSASAARDLFYTYDSLGRFLSRPENDTGRGASSLREGKDYITYNALGTAILRSNNLEEVEELLPAGFVHGGRRRSVVLIDEIDKAPRDFPNDLLNEVENLYFRVPELNNVKVAAMPDMPPVLIITSNSEKHLPDAFLRRCVYYNIPFPTPKRLEEIVLAHLAFLGNETGPLLEEALDFLFYLREPSNGLLKKPSTAELIEWLVVLSNLGAKSVSSLRQHKGWLELSLSTLVKSAEDQNKAAEILDAWLNPKRPASVGE